MDKETPTPYPVPLLNGFVPDSDHLCEYHKTQDGLVVVNVAVQSTAGEFPVGDVYLAQLPVGYRPLRNIAITGGSVGINPTDSGRILELTVDPSGSIRAGLSGLGMVAVWGTVVFFAD